MKLRVRCRCCRLILLLLQCCRSWTIPFACSWSSSTTRSPAVAGGPFAAKTKRVLLLRQQQQQQQQPADDNERPISPNNNAAAAVHAAAAAAADDNSITHSIGLYIHIPFCRQRCRYCNFAIVPIGRSAEEQNDGFAAMNRNYTAAILKELRSVQQPPAVSSSANSNKSNSKKKIPLSSIYFGGGTPSLAPMETFQEIMAFLHSDDSPFEFANDDMEITMEMDPGTFSRDKLQAFKDVVGVNRISLGIQSFDNDMLQRLGRFHRRDDIQESVAMLVDVYGGDNDNDNINYSIDLISGLPGLSLASWIETLQTATTSLHPAPSHMSLYDLTIEAGTVFGKWYDNNNDGKKEGRRRRRQQSSSFSSTRGEAPTQMMPPLPTDEESAFQYSFAAGYLRSKGYEHYEVSSYAKITTTTTTTASNHRSTSKSHCRSRHNQIYWGYDTQWYAAGLGATSFVQGKLGARPRTLYDYLVWVDSQKHSNEEEEDDNEFVHDDDDDDDLDILMDVVLKRLRTSAGLDLDWVRRRFGQEYSSAISKGAELGLELGLAVYEDPVLRLIDSKGFLYSNSIISSIFVELEEQSMKQ